MPFTAALVIGGANLIGGASQANATENAAYQSAAAQRESARLAAEAAKFRPVGVTTRYGTSNFQMSPEGYLTGAGYNVSPELQAYQNRLSGLAGGALTQAEQAGQQYAPLSQAATGLFGLGQQYLAQSPQQVAAQYIQQQQDLLAPSRERQMAQLQNQLFQQGRGGLSVGATGARPSGAAGLGATTPEMEAYYNALAQQDAALAANAQQAGQQNVAFGAGLFGSGSNLLNQYQTGQTNALAPFQNYLTASQGIEQMGQQPLTLGAGLGGQSAAYGANAGRSLLVGGIGAAETQQKGSQYDPLAGLLTGLAGSQQLSQGLQNYFNPPYVQNQNAFNYGQTTGFSDNRPVTLF
jgi:hypothetical protein